MVHGAYAEFAETGVEVAMPPSMNGRTTKSAATTGISASTRMELRYTLKHQVSRLTTINIQLYLPNTNCLPWIFIQLPDYPDSRRRTGLTRCII